MDRVSTNYAMKAAASDFLRAQMRQVEAQQQVSDGKKADDLMGYGRDSTTLTAARTVQSRVETFVENATSLSGRLETQSMALERVVEVAGEARSAVGSAVANGRGETLMIELNSWFAQASQALNTKHDGSQLFSGGRVDVPSVQINTLAQLAALPTVADAFHNDAAAPVARLDEATTATAGFLASEVGQPLFTLFREIQDYHASAAGPLNGPLTPAQQTWLEGKLAQFSDVQKELIVTASENGLMQRRVQDAMDTQKARGETLEGFIGSVRDVDMAEAITRLQSAQAAVQASAYALNVLKSTSLLDLLQP